MAEDRRSSSLAMKRAAAFALIPMILASAPARAWPPPGPAANIRPCYVAGYTLPGGRPGYGGGYGFGAAFEAEHAQAVSLLLHVEWDWLTETRNGPSYDGSDLALFTWSVGARGYLRRAATLRPYGELDVGVRLGGEDEESGTSLVPRLGITMASSGRAGLLLECAASFTTRDPERFLFVPIRFGVVFP